MTESDLMQLEKADLARMVIDLQRKLNAARTDHVKTLTRQAADYDTRARLIGGDWKQ